MYLGRFMYVISDIGHYARRIILGYDYELTMAMRDNVRQKSFSHHFFAYIKFISIESRT